MRVLLGVVGVLLLLAGIATAGAAAWASSVFGADGVLRYDAGTITPAPGTIATIVDVDRFDATVPYIDALGTTSLSVTSDGRGDPSDTVFLGAADTARVDAYVRGTAYSVGIREGGEWTVRAVPGAARPELPRSQDLWITDDVGRRAAIEVPQARPLTLVLMHPSAIPSGPLVLSVDFTVPDVATWITWLLVVAAGLVLLGVILVVIAVRRRRGGGRHRPGASTVGTEVTSDAHVG
jgi:hypothetical protein